MKSIRNLAIALVLAMGAAACGDDGEGATDTSTTTSTTEAPETSSTAPTTSAAPTSTTEAPLTASFRGVTEDTIKIGVAYVDFDQLKNDFGVIDFTHGDEVAIWEALIADLNANGGINGRMLEAVYDTYLPIGSVEAEESCLIFTEDEEVFAVLGVWVGESVLCLTEVHDTIHIGHLVRQEWIDRSSAVLATPDTAEERQLEVLLTVLDQTGRLEGRTVGVLTDVIAESSVSSVVEPFFEGLDADLASVGVMTDTEGDQVAIAAEIEAFSERWRTEGVDMLLVVGNNGLARIPEVLDVVGDIDVVTPSGSVLQQTSGNAEGDRLAGYDGVITLSGLDPLDGEQFEEPGLQRCVQIVEEATGVDIVARGELGDDPDDWAAGVGDACGSLEVFRLAATAAGNELTNDSFRAGLEGLGSVDIPGNAFSSFGPGKYDGADGFRLVEFDPFDGEEGSFVALTDIVDTAATG